MRVLGIVEVEEGLAVLCVSSAELSVLHGALASSFPFTASPNAKFRGERDRVESRKRRRWRGEKERGLGLGLRGASPGRAL